MGFWDHLSRFTFPKTTLQANLENVKPHHQDSNQGFTVNNYGDSFPPGVSVKLFSLFVIFTLDYSSCKQLLIALSAHSDVLSI